jgi:hypothetical protein
MAILLGAARPTAGAWGTSYQRQAPCSLACVTGPHNGTKGSRTSNELTSAD